MSKAPYTLNFKVIISIGTIYVLSSENTPHFYSSARPAAIYHAIHFKVGDGFMAKGKWGHPLQGTHTNPLYK